MMVRKGMMGRIWTSVQW